MSPTFAHPGSITFIDADGTERTEPADRLPDWVKFAPAADGGVRPVVKVARVPADGGFSVRSFGADGRLLAVTLPIPTIPPAAAPTRAPTAAGWF
jgi:hypothetical protein